ncbi:four-carbon acid sugar kinase family protein [Vibrio mediterranei]|uniref:four-carbon acid sugar kinase family protein n=1 Tax=Vibrio mediterranei TaxID=689 RepID=UPI0038CDE042
MPKLIVIADDFTGSNDTGVQLAKKGALVTVALNNEPISCDIPVVNTESRARSSAEAASSVSSACEVYVELDTHVVFKKIDSTFRGNIGAELEAAAKSFGAKLVVVAGAIPSAGRTTVDGRCLVNGVPVTDTEFATDPKTPVQFSQIDKIISSQSTLECRNMFLKDLRQGELDQAIDRIISGAHPVVLIVDSETDDDLALIAKSLSSVSEGFVLVGAAGIANQLPKSLFLNEATPPVLVLAGSMSEVTQQQVSHCEQRGLAVIDVDAQEVWRNPDQAFSKAACDAKRIIQSGRHCAIRTSRDQAERQRAHEFCEQEQITGTDMANVVAGFFGRLGRVLMDENKLAGVLFTGGDIATAVAADIGADGYEIKGEVLPCVPFGNFTGHSIPVVTKAGGFGQPDSIERIIDFLKDHS